MRKALVQATSCSAYARGPRTEHGRGEMGRVEKREVPSGTRLPSAQTGAQRRALADQIETCRAITNVGAALSGPPRARVACSITLERSLDLAPAVADVRALSNEANAACNG